jgi:AcrR family transcriptional regulator
LADAAKKRSRKSPEARRAEILGAARRVFVEKGFQAATVDDIVAAVEIARGTFYLYFPDKRAVFEALIDEFLERIAACVSRIDLDPGAPPWQEQLRGNLRRVVELALSEPTIVKLALYDATGLDPELDDKLHAYYEWLRAMLDRSMAEGQAAGIVRGGDRRLMVSFAMGGLKEMLVDAVSGEVEPNADRVVDELMRILLDGMLSAETST